MTAPAGFRLTGSALDDGQREILAQALADALAWREPCGPCADCPAGEDIRACPDHIADETLASAYLALARELGLEIPA